MIEINYYSIFRAGMLTGAVGYIYYMTMKTKISRSAINAVNHLEQEDKNRRTILKIEKKVKEDDEAGVTTHPRLIKTRDRFTISDELIHEARATFVFVPITNLPQRAALREFLRVRLADKVSLRHKDRADIIRSVMFACSQPCEEDVLAYTATKHHYNRLRNTDSNEAMWVRHLRAFFGRATRPEGA
jgi:hypothetical protein